MSIANVGQWIFDGMTTPLLLSAFHLGSAVLQIGVTSFEANAQNV